MPAVDDLKNLDRMDQVVLGAGVLAFILSFFHFLTASVSGVGASALGGLGGYGHESAWHGWGFLGMLFVLVATAIAAGRLFAAASMPKLPVGINLLTLVLSGLGFLFLLIEGLKNTKSAGVETFKVSVHIGIAGWLLLIVILAQAVAAFLLFKKSGEVMPDFKAMSANKTAAGQVSAPPTAPPAAYPPATATPAGDFTFDESPVEPPPV